MSDLSKLITCPHCGSPNDQHDDAGFGDNRGPRDGDVGICMSCVKPSVFATVDGQLTQRIPSKEEADMIARDPDLMQALAQASYARRIGMPGAAVRDALRDRFRG